MTPLTILLSLLVIIIILLFVVLFKKPISHKSSKKLITKHKPIKSKQSKSSKPNHSKQKHSTPKPPKAVKVSKSPRISKDFKFNHLLKEKKHLVLDSDKLFFKLFIDGEYYPKLLVTIDLLFNKIKLIDRMFLPKTTKQWRVLLKSYDVNPELLNFLSKTLSKSDISKETLKDVLLQGIFLKLDNNLLKLEHLLDTRFALIFEQRIVALSLKHTTAHPKSFKEYISFLNNEKKLIIKILHLVRLLKKNKNLDFINYLRKDAKKLYKGNSFVSETLLSEQFLL